MMQLIGINGLKRSGKGATASAIGSILGPSYSVLEVGFADKVKLWAAMSLGLTGTDEELIAMMNEAKESWDIMVANSNIPVGYGAVTHSITGRQYIQHTGNQARLLFGEDFWVDQVLPRISGTFGKLSPSFYLGQRYRGVDVLVMADLRYENEAQRILDLGGTIWEVIRPGLESDGHDSEQPLPPNMIHWQIINDGSLDVLRDRTAQALYETTHVD